MVAMTLTILDRHLYDEQLAAQILGLPASTLHWWLEGGERRGRRYEPVLRREPTGAREVTWGELVEAQYLKAYRRDLGVKLLHLRAFISRLRDELGVPYPLAHVRPWVGPGRQLLWRAQEEARVEDELWACYETPSGQVLLTPPAQSFLERVEFSEDESGVAIRYWPMGKDAHVAVDPEVRFGSPAVKGIPTEALAEQVRAGDSVESVAADFGLDLEDAIAALNYENLHRRHAA